MRLSSPNSRAAGQYLAIGFASTVAMWVLGYFALMKPGLIVGEFLFGLTLACLLAGGLMAGRSLSAGEQAWKAGLKIGLVSATLNLLLIGSLIGGESGHEKVLHAIAWAAGTYLVSITLAVIGVVVGAAATTRPIRRQLRQRSRIKNWFHLYTCVAAVTVFLLLITGGLVTGLQAGMAVPDWPNSFGHNMLLYPMSQMTGGIYYEHAHRLYGMLVGVTAITLAAGMFWFDDRRWMRRMGVIYLLMVCVQGVLGGTRVTQTSITLAIIHGIFGQIVFATIVSIAAFTSSTWRSLAAPIIKREAVTDRALATLLPLMLIAQLALGALYRHLRRDWNVPPEPMPLLFAHIILAILVTLLAIFVGGRAWGLHRDRPVLPILGKTLLCLIGGQLVLGVCAMIVVWSRPAAADGQPIAMIEIVVTTAHQAAGALLLATATLLMIWTRRNSRAATPPWRRTTDAHGSQPTSRCARVA